ncbi:MAG: hypothetical protein U0838_00065 [Chloroflexota bacterium]
MPGTTRAATAQRDSPPWRSPWRARARRPPRAYSIGGVLLPWELAMSRFGIVAPLAIVLAAGAKLAFGVDRPCAGWSGSSARHPLRAARLRRPRHARPAPAFTRSRWSNCFDVPGDAQIGDIAVLDCAKPPRRGLRCRQSGRGRRRADRLPGITGVVERTRRAARAPCAYAGG